MAQTEEESGGKKGRGEEKGGPTFTGQMPLELHRELVCLKAAHARLVNARGPDTAAVARFTQVGGGTGHLKILNQLYPSLHRIAPQSR